jgi:small conductance mechanosensitive channel
MLFKASNFLSLNKLPRWCGQELLWLLVLMLASLQVFAQAAAEDAATKPLSEADVAGIETVLEDIRLNMTMARNLDARASDNKNLEQRVIRTRVSGLWADSLELTIKLAKTLADQRAAGYEVDPYLPEVIGDLTELPELIRNYSRRPGDSAERTDPTLSPLEQAVNDDRVFAAGDEYDDGSWAIYRSIEASGLLGVDTSTQKAYLQERVQELLANAIVFLDMSMRDVSNLRAAVKALPQDADVTAKLRIAENRVAGIVRIMENNLQIMDRLGLPSAYYRQQLVSVTGKVSAELFDAEIISGLLAGWVNNLKEVVRIKGPNFIFQLLLLLVIIYVFIKLSSWVKHLIEKAIDASGIQASRLAKRMITAVSGNLVLVIGLLVALSQLGVSLGPVLAGLGIVGFIIGFALQDSLGNFASGVLILIYRPYDVGDMVEVSGVTGRVHQMSLVNTTILTLDNQTLIIPNNKIWQDVIKNLTYQTKRRVDLVFGITYDQDIDVVEELLHKILKEEERVLDYPEPNIRVHELGDSSVNLICRPWVKTDDYWDVYWDLTKKVKQAFDAAGITIPFPQRDVHLFGGDADGETAAENALQQTTRND